MKNPLRTQLDLFAPAVPPAKMSSEERVKAVMLLQSLLVEAASAPGADCRVGAGSRRAMSKITAEHLCRSPIIYIRQSTTYQVANNLESQRRQDGLTERTRQLGWDDVQIVDDDLGRSGAGTARPGFGKLWAAMCEGRVGAVISLEASRLARWP
ncbi:recombinase family protein [Mesorhizobium sp.]|nr:recombinase family protein [Mesorhizobium sp.]